MSAAGVEGFQVEASPSSSPLMRLIAVKTRPKCLELIPQHVATAAKARGGTTRKWAFMNRGDEMTPRMPRELVTKAAFETLKAHIYGQKVSAHVSEDLILTHGQPASKPRRPESQGSERRQKRDVFTVRFLVDTPDVWL